MGADDGVWGGHTEQDRQALRRRRRRDRTSQTVHGAAETVRLLQAASRQRTTNAADALQRNLPTQAS